MEKIIDTESVENLYKAVLQLSNAEECANFLRDLCTVSEIRAMAERLEVAKQVEEGTPYRTINKNTGVSTATITRVAHWLHHGMGGYELVLARLKS